MGNDVLRDEGVALAAALEAAVALEAAAAARDYAAGAGLQALSAKYHVTPREARGMVVLGGGTIRGRGWPRRKE